MPENRHLRFLLRLLYAALALAGLWLALRFLLPWLLPFLLAFSLAALLEPAVRLLMERLHLPRRGAAALCTAALTAAVLGGLALVVWRVGYELSLLLGRLPTLLAAVLFGPVEGFAVGAVADMIGGTLSGYAINPLITLGAGSIGLTAGLLWRALPNLRLGLRTQISVFAGHAVGSIVINSLALHLFYNYPWSVLVTRIPNALVLAAVNTVLVRLLLENKTIRGIAQ